MTKKSKIIIIVILLLSVFSFLFLISSNRGIGMRIDGVNVTEKELELFQRQYQTISDDKEAFEVVTEKAAEAKLILIWAKKHGLLKDISYAGFLKQLDEENKKRKDELEKGRVIYGPVSFSEIEYYQYRLTDLKQKIIDKEGKKISDREILRQYYEEQREDYRRCDIIDGEVSVWEELVMISKERVHIDSTNIRIMTEGSEAIVQLLLELSEGDSEIIETEGKQILVSCIRREDGGYKPFEEVIQAVHASYMESWFQNQLEEQRKEAHVKYFLKKGNS